MTELSRTGFDGNQTGRTTTYACAEKYPEELLERAIGTMLDGTWDPASSPDACTRDRCPVGHPRTDAPDRATSACVAARPRPGPLARPHQMQPGSCVAFTDQDRNQT